MNFEAPKIAVKIYGKSGHFNPTVHNRQMSYQVETSANSWGASECEGSRLIMGRSMWAHRLVLTEFM